MTLAIFPSFCFLILSKNFFTVCLELFISEQFAENLLNFQGWFIIQFSKVLFCVCCLNGLNTLCFAVAVSLSDSLNSISHFFENVNNFFYFFQQFKIHCLNVFIADFWLFLIIFLATACTVYNFYFMLSTDFFIFFLCFFINIKRQKKNGERGI